MLLANCNALGYVAMNASRTPGTHVLNPAGHSSIPSARIGADSPTSPSDDALERQLCSLLAGDSRGARVMSLKGRPLDFV